MATRLIAVRHAKPASSDPALYPDDDLRPLLDEGKRAQLEVAEKLKLGGYIPQLILASPVTRAKETAEILAKVLVSRIETEPALGANFNPDALIKRFVVGETLLVVGHNPTLASFVNSLLGFNFFVGGMPQSAAIVVEFEGTITYGLASFLAYYPS